MNSKHTSKTCASFSFLFFFLRAQIRSKEFKCEIYILLLNILGRTNKEQNNKRTITFKDGIKARNTFSLAATHQSWRQNFAFPSLFSRNAKKYKYIFYYKFTDFYPWTKKHFTSNYAHSLENTMSKIHSSDSVITKHTRQTFSFYFILLEGPKPVTYALWTTERFLICENMSNSPLKKT